MSEEYMDSSAIKAKINSLYEEMRALAVELLELNINQYDGKLLRVDAEKKLTALVDRHFNIESELFKYQKLLESIENQKMK